jgi:hypothetical protein
VSDFLSRLIDRSAGTASAARPVIAPLFGPAPAAAEPAFEARPAMETATQVEVPPAQAHPATAHPSVAPPVPEDVATNVAASAEPPRGTPVMPAVERRARDADGVDGAHAPHARFTVEPALQSPASRPRSQEVEPPAVRVAHASAEAEAPRPEPRLVRVSSIQPAEASRPAAALSAERSRPAEEGPVVVVNIGRIEVRATTPPAAAPPLAPRKPAAVSLEEYLQPRRRNR